MKYLIFLLAFLMISCGQNSVDIYTFKIQIDSGEIVNCQIIKKSFCGVDLENCMNNELYACQSNIKVLDYSF